MAMMDMNVGAMLCDYEPDADERERMIARNRISKIGYDDIWPRSPTPPIRDPDDFTSEEEDAPKIDKDYNISKTRLTKKSKASSSASKSKSSRKRNKKSKKSSSSKKRKFDDSSDSDVPEFDPDNSGEGDSGDGDEWVAVKPVKSFEAVRAAEKERTDAPIFMQEGFDAMGVGPGVPKFIHEQIKRENVSKHKGDFIEKAKIPKDFGHALLRGEGEAMAQFVEAGVRIPRRGEIGLTAAEIDHYEKQGYVMSGTRHLRMEAIRLRKESQIYNIDERRALGVMHRVEKEKKEYEVIQQFRNLINKKIVDRKEALSHQKEKQDQLKRTQKEHEKTRIK